MSIFEYFLVTPNRYLGAKSAIMDFRYLRRSEARPSISLPQFLIAMAWWEFVPSLILLLQFALFWAKSRNYLFACSRFLLP